MAEGLSKDEIISSFCGITGVSSSEATDFLNDADWDADAALAEFYQRQEEGDAPEGASGDAAAAASGASGGFATANPAYTGPRTLDGRPAPHSSRAAAPSSSRQAPKRKGLVTLSSLQGGGGGAHAGHGHGHDDDDDDDYDDDDDENHGRGDLFAGGEKSGLAVQDPTMGGPSSDARRVMRDIVAKAKANHQAREEPAAAPSRFRGSGQTLGGEGTESRTIPDPRAAPAAAGAGAGPNAPREDAEQRVLHIWQDGFSIDDGPLHRYDDPQNAADLQMIRQGRAPLHLMNVPFGQAVDIKLHEHEEAWHQLPRVYRPFAGEGRRLGAPVPGAGESASASIAEVAAAPAAAAPASSSSGTAAPTVDDSQPIVNIRVQLPDGRRLPARFNTTHTINDVYSFVEQNLPASATQGRAWVLATTFPNKEHTDKSLVLGETDEFKRGGAAVVKWV